jgi:hypothetical protein
LSEAAPDSVARNVAAWTKSNAESTDAKATEARARDGIDRGVFEVPEPERWPSEDLWAARKRS